MTVKELASKHRFRVRQDEDLTDIIPGKVGHIYEYDDNLLGAMVMPNPPRRQYWTFAKRALIAAGCVVVQDGDGEGAATFDPNDSEQIKAAMKATGVYKIRRAAPPSPAQLEARRKLIERRSGKAQ